MIDQEFRNWRTGVSYHEWNIVSGTRHSHEGGARSEALALSSISGYFGASGFPLSREWHTGREWRSFLLLYIQYSFGRL